MSGSVSVPKAEEARCPRSDMSTFFEDVKTVRPTAMMIIPRIANMVYDQAQEKLRKAKGSDKQVVLPFYVS